MTRTSLAKRSSNAANFALFNVPVVASTPTTPERVASAAGLTAGSIPTSGRSGYSRRSSAMPAAVAVLHATTNALAPCPNRKAAIVRQRSRMNSGLFSPYGTWPLSAKYSSDSLGRRARISLSTDRPPTPESKTPTGALSAIGVTANRAAGVALDPEFSEAARKRINQQQTPY